MPPIRHHINLAISALTIRLDKSDISLFVNHLSANTPFSFARFGDGEWSAIVGKAGSNCDGHAYTGALKDSLATCIREPKNYWYGMQPFALRTMALQIVPYIIFNRIKLHWYNANILHYANISGNLAPFLRELRNKECVIIAPPYLRALDRNVLKYSHFIDIPPVNCFEASGEIINRINAYAAGKKNVVYLFSASMAANSMIHLLYDTLGKENWLIDAGSLWDIYVNVKSRSVYEKQDWAPIIEKNLTSQGGTQ